MKKRLVISTGAGMSAESGISTFRDNGGLWEQYDVKKVCTVEAFAKNPALVHRFYSERRKALLKAVPNAGHLGLVDLEQDFDTYIITQNVDDLHERAGSSRVLHLHGELMKVRSMNDESKVFTLSPDSLETSPETRIEGEPVRPHIVFFGEPVPNFEKAVELVRQADIFVVIGTSLTVQPAAGLFGYVRPGTEVYYIDPCPTYVSSSRIDIDTWGMTASAGVAKLKEVLQP